MPRQALRDNFKVLIKPLFNGDKAEVFYNPSSFHFKNLILLHALNKTSPNYWKFQL